MCSVNKKKSNFSSFSNEINNEDNLPKIQLNSSNDFSFDNASEKSFKNFTVQKNTFIKKCEKPIQSCLLLPTSNFENTKSEKRCKPSSSFVDNKPPLSAPIFSEKNRKSRASIAFDFNILHYLTIGHYFGNKKEQTKVPSFLKQFSKQNMSNDCTIEKKEKSELILEKSESQFIDKNLKNLKKKFKKKKKKKKSVKSKTPDELLIRENEKNDYLVEELINLSKKNECSKKFLNKNLNKSSSDLDKLNKNLSSSASSTLSLNLMQKVNKLQSNFVINKKGQNNNELNDIKKRRHRKNKQNLADDQMLLKHGRVIVPSEPNSLKSMMQWSPNFSKINSEKNNLFSKNLDKYSNENFSSENSLSSIDLSFNSKNKPIKGQITNKKKFSNHHHHPELCHHKVFFNSNKHCNLNENKLKSSIFSQLIKNFTSALRRSMSFNINIENKICNYCDQAYSKDLINIKQDNTFFSLKRSASLDFIQIYLKVSFYFKFFF